MFLYIRHAILDDDPAGNGGREFVVRQVEHALARLDVMEPSPTIPPGPVAHASTTTFRPSLWKNHLSAMGGIMRPD